MATAVVRIETDDDMVMLEEMLQEMPTLVGYEILQEE